MGDVGAVRQALWDGRQGSWMTEWSLTPQQKGVLTGIRKDSPAGTLCPGDGGGYLTEPMTATRERNVDPGVDVTVPTYGGVPYAEGPSERS